MTTSLGGAKTVGMRIHVKNGAGATIKRGAIVALNTAAGNPLAEFLDLTQKKDYGVGNDRQLEVPFVSVVLAPHEATAAAGLYGRLGVAMADIPANGFGEVCPYGIVQCINFLSVTAGEVVTVGLLAAGAASNGTVNDAANATDKNPIGFALETSAVVGALVWCFINCLNWDGAGTAFGGKAY